MDNIDVSDFENDLQDIVDDPGVGPGIDKILTDITKIFNFGADLINTGFGTYQNIQGSGSGSSGGDYSIPNYQGQAQPQQQSTLEKYLIPGAIILGGGLIAKKQGWI